MATNYHMQMIDRGAIDSFLLVGSAMRKSLCESVANKKFRLILSKK